MQTEYKEIERLSQANKLLLNSLHTLHHVQNRCPASCYALNRKTEKLQTDKKFTALKRKSLLNETSDVKQVATFDIKIENTTLSH